MRQGVFHSVFHGWHFFLCVCWSFRFCRSPFPCLPCCFLFCISTFTVHSMQNNKVDLQNAAKSTQDRSSKMKTRTHLNSNMMQMTCKLRGGTQNATDISKLFAHLKFPPIRGGATCSTNFDNTADAIHPSPWQAQKGAGAPYLTFNLKTIKCPPAITCLHTTKVAVDYAMAAMVMLRYTGAMLRFMGRFHEGAEVGRTWCGMISWPSSWCGAPLSREEQQYSSTFEG